MATRFKKMRTRKLRKTKALKTRKHRGGNWFTKKPITSVAPATERNNSTDTVKLVTNPMKGKNSTMMHPIFNKKIVQRMQSNEKKAVLQILENEKQSLEMKKKERMGSLNLHEKLRQDFTKYKEGDEKKLKEAEESKKLIKSQNLQKLTNNHIYDINIFIKNRIFMINQEERIIKETKSEIEEIDKKIQKVEMEIQKVKNT